MFHGNRGRKFLSHERSSESNLVAIGIALFVFERRKLIFLKYWSHFREASLEKLLLIVLGPSMCITYSSAAYREARYRSPLKLLYLTMVRISIIIIVVSGCFTRLSLLVIISTFIVFSGRNSQQV